MEFARVEGLAKVQAQELVQFSNGVMGTAFSLEKDSVGVIVMGEYSGIIEGMIVRGTGRIASVPVGDALIGRVSMRSASRLTPKVPSLPPAFARLNASHRVWFIVRTWIRPFKPVSNLLTR